MAKLATADGEPDVAAIATAIATATALTEEQVRAALRGVAGSRDGGLASLGAIEGKLANDSDATWRRFNSQADAAFTLRIDSGSLTQVLNGRRKKAGGWVFRRIEGVTKTNKENKDAVEAKRADAGKDAPWKPYKSKAAAARDLGLDPSSVAKHIKDPLKAKHVGGWVFRTVP